MARRRNATHVRTLEDKMDKFLYNVVNQFMDGDIRMFDVRRRTPDRSVELSVTFVDSKFLLYYFFISYIAR
jgi:hypothetical protein